MIDPSAISIAVNALRTHLSGCFTADPHETGNVHISISHPAAALNDPTDATHVVNIFVYRIEHGGYPADATCNDPLFVKLHCLLTSFAKKENQFTAGEMDLRIIGHIMQRLNEKPILYLPEGATTASPELAARLQIVPEQITTDEMNKIWSTQSETSFKPSLAYELALVPVPLKERARPGGGVVGRIGVQAVANLGKVPLPTDGFHIPVRNPVVAPMVIDDNDPGWSPYICFVDEHGFPAPTLLRSRNEKVTILIAGAVSDTATKSLSIMEQRWEENKGWGKAQAKEGNVTVDTAAIDPNAVYSDVKNKLSFDIDKGHVLLYVKRTWVRPSDGSVTEGFSNPILLTITGLAE